MNSLSIVRWQGFEPEVKNLVLSEHLELKQGLWFAGFEDMLLENPHLLDTYIDKAEQEKLTGVEKVGSKYIVEEMRRDGLRDKRNKALFNINNNYTADLARLAMQMFPIELKGFFRVRELKRGFTA